MWWRGINFSYHVSSTPLSEFGHLIPLLSRFVVHIVEMLRQHWFHLMRWLQESQFLVLIHIGVGDYPPVKPIVPLLRQRLLVPAEIHHRSPLLESRPRRNARRYWDYFDLLICPIYFLREWCWYLGMQELGNPPTKSVKKGTSLDCNINRFKVEGRTLWCHRLVVHQQLHDNNFS